MIDYPPRKWADEEPESALRLVPNEPPPPPDEDDLRSLYAAGDGPVRPGNGLRGLVGAADPGSIPAAVLEQMKADPEVAGLVLRRIREQTARSLHAEIDAARHPRPEPDCGTLAQLLARPSAPPYRIGGLLPSGGRLLVTAQFKAGKTTLVGNLAHALLTGDDFLGRFPVQRIDGRVVVLNYEVTGAQFASWMRDVGVPADGMFVVNLRGCRNPLADEQGRRDLVELIRQQDGAVLMVDPFGRAYTGGSQNDAAEVTPWLVRLDELAETAGCSELVLTAHAGWNGERTRGSTALNDWPDVLVTLNKDEGTDGQRYFRADGRDVDVPEDRLRFDPSSRRLFLTGTGSRAQSKAKAKGADLLAALVLAVAREPGLNVTQLEESIRNSGTCPFQKGDVARASREAERLGKVQVQKGSRGARLHFLLVGPPIPTSPDLPQGDCGRWTGRPPPPPRPLIGSGAGGGQSSLAPGQDLETQLDCDCARQLAPGGEHHTTCEAGS